uniref:uncharacterized protein LOC122607645 n=1 Tax=Erigeron canadensis TaxID=72917 RepID=UPI001CB9CA8B|nr:uncharacterized protein LOC122607645 [Erigeron canadensis]
MWKSRRKPNNEITTTTTTTNGGSFRRSFSNLNFINSSLKDIETLLADDQPPPAATTATATRRLSIFHRVHLANKFARAFTKPNTNSPAAAFTLPAAAAAAVQLTKSDRQISTETEKLGKSDSRISVPAVAKSVAKSDRQISIPVENTAVTYSTKSDRRISNPVIPMTKSDRQVTFPVETLPEISKSIKSDRRISIPGAETRIIVYTTSLRVVRSTFEACRTVQSILRGFRVSIDERDLSMDSKFLDELHDVMAVIFENNDLTEKSKKLSLPKVFIGGRYIGGVEEVRQLHESGELKKIVDSLPPVTRGVCESCGDFRFVLCDECSGSHKCYSEKSGFRCCNLCNENGLVRCPVC